MDVKREIGEVVEASTTEFLAESRELHSPPPFGSFVKVEAKHLHLSPPSAASIANQDDPFMESAGKFDSQYNKIVMDLQNESGDAPPSAIYAVVYHASTTSADPSKRLRAFWKDEEKLREEQPELSEWMLVTNFRAITIGYSSEGFAYQALPPQPPRLFTWVYPCSSEEIRLLTSKLDFLRTLANFRNSPTEEILAACIREACDNGHSNNPDFVVAAGKELANLMKDDYDRLQAIMRRISP